MRAFSNNVVLLLLLFFIQTSQLCFCKNITSSCYEGERLALLRFRASFKNTSQGPLGSWEGSDCCKWKGVGCDPITRHVIKLDLRPPPIFDYYYSYFLEAENVNSSLLELENLSYLDLSGIKFFSSPIPIPEFLGSMRRLRYLNISSCGFIGKIPHHLGNLSSLRALDLSYNLELYDDDMSWISKLSSLKHLALGGVSLEKAYNLFQVLFKLPSLSLADLSDCRIINIHIPRGIVNSTFLANVEVLNLRYNALHGSFPDAFQNMTSIKDLDLSWNSLSLIPHWLANLHSLVHVDLSKNHFRSSEVSIESILGNMCSLISLDLSYNVHELVPSLKFGHGNLSGCTRYVLEELRLTQSGVGDSFPTWLGKLKWLRVLELSHNHLSGSIPTSLGGLSNLIDLSLLNNYLTGTIPSNIAMLYALKYLSLSNNLLNGSIPSSLGRLSNLTVLDLSNNKLKGIVPQNLGKLVSLEILELSNNSLLGAFSELHLANLSNLSTLAIGFNSLIVKIRSDWIPPFKFLSSMGMSSCNLGRQFPQWLKNMTFLKRLDLSNSNIGGVIPNWIEEMYSIEKLDLSNNQISGSIPEIFGHSVPNLVDIILKNNLLEGSIPKSLCTINSLLVLDLSNNRLFGTIPNCWRGMSIDILNLSSNKLSGNIPSSFGHSFGVGWLNLSNNSLYGELHEELKNIENLQILDLGGNQFSGIIPSWIQNFQELQVLRLSHNLFTSEIPSSLCQLTFLQILDLAGNKLFGLIPHCICHLTSMTIDKNAIPYPIDFIAPTPTIVFSSPPSPSPSPIAPIAVADSPIASSDDQWKNEGTKQVLKGLELDYTKTLEYLVNFDLSHNNLVGSIPEGLTCLSGLIGLNLSHNNLSGKIPSKMEDMKSLESMDLSSNNLYGPIPPTMSTMTFLSHLNLSNNNFSGLIPKGPQFSSYDPSSFAGNPYLCGDPLGKACSPKGIIQPEPPVNVEEEDNAERKEKVLFYFVVALGFITGFWGSIGVLIYKRNWRHACFRRVENLADILYVETMIRTARLKKMIKKTQ